MILEDYVLFYNWLTDAEVNDTLCIQTRNDGKFIIKLIKHEKEGTPLRGHGIQYGYKRIIPKYMEVNIMEDKNSKNNIIEEMDRIKFNLNFFEMIKPIPAFMTEKIHLEIIQHIECEILLTMLCFRKQGITWASIFTILENCDEDIQEDIKEALNNLIKRGLLIDDYPLYKINDESYDKIKSDIYNLILTKIETGNY